MTERDSCLMAEDSSIGPLAVPENVFVISGPSGVGKNSIAGRLCACGQAVRAVTATARSPKLHEEDGKDYFFVSPQQFERWAEEGRLLEHARYCGNCYGTPAFSVQHAARSGLPVLLVVDVEGAFQIKEKWPHVRLIFVMPPSDQALVARLRARGRDDEESIAGRLRRAREEMALATKYDYVVTNDVLEDAVDEVLGIIQSYCRALHNRGTGRCPEQGA